MELGNAIIQGNARAASLAKSMVENPTLISTTSPYIFTISLECESYRQYSDADVAESIVISTEPPATLPK